VCEKREEREERREKRREREKESEREKREETKILRPPATNEARVAVVVVEPISTNITLLASSWEGE